MLVRDLVRRAEDRRRASRRGARTAGYLTEAAQVINLAAAALASELRAVMRRCFRGYRIPPPSRAGADRTQAWTALRNAAATEYRFAVERIHAATTVSQADGARRPPLDPMLRSTSGPWSRSRRIAAASFHHADLRAPGTRASRTLAEQADRGRGRHGAPCVGIAERWWQPKRASH